MAVSVTHDSSWAPREEGKRDKTVAKELEQDKTDAGNLKICWEIADSVHRQH